MHSFSAVHKIDEDIIELFIRENGIVKGAIGGKTLGRKTRSSNNKLLENIAIEDLIVSVSTKSTSLVKVALRENTRIVSATKRNKKSTEDEKAIPVTHNIEVEIDKTAIKSARCSECYKTNTKCSQIYACLVWIQLKQMKDLQEPENQEQMQKKIKSEQKVDNVLKPANMDSEHDVIKPLPKLKKEIIQISPTELKSAMNLSMFSLIREYSSNDPNEFLKYCTERMQEGNCSNAQFLTVEQADTDLWHELRKGRITASRIYEASRCTMLSGSLTNKIMGISSGFSFAMKRGTDLEGHVFAVLKKQYPSLRETGLVLDAQFPWMGASPDGISDEFVLEIKCPYTPKTYECYIDVKKLSKKYFAQIQLQMHMTHKTKALLGVAALDFERTRNVTQVWIDYDREYVDNIMKDAFEFWQRGVFPALLRKRKSMK
ncbi:uncharacterized protein LOC131681586 isoform X2 [Topomyia yanbarensis]|nr:uncharacterized protein LOC131681586 isoform X2 [Topomyia yanbarensis]XP_058818449.1 uncharacterized protein LOC131681586 isoform X2 [Topomyia yanbarensis]XP_058818450.1 uncharacterized protein LOC131681586 isoform X2 [Topomyia yanbarensis]XP_058818451.1 uncharacterized protein LOC131681586 isoform X2 [Topomyia yanbarensis]